MPLAPPSNARVAAYLPGDLVASRSCLVVCNGGSPTSNQALAAGVPVLGIASNMDQFLNMCSIVSACAGRMLRADRLTPNLIRSVCLDIIHDQIFRNSALRISESSDVKAAAARFSSAIEFLAN